jgi:hypothetical protein
MVITVEIFTLSIIGKDMQFPDVLQVRSMEQILSERHLMSS